MTKKNILALALSMVLLFSFSVPAFGASPVKRMGNTVPTPYAQFISASDARVSISSGGVNVTSYVNGIIGATTRVEILTELQQYNNGWRTINTYSASGAYSARINQNQPVSSGFRYRAVAHITAYSGSQTESISVTSSEVRY